MQEPFRGRLALARLVGFQVCEEVCQRPPIRFDLGLQGATSRLDGQCWEKDGDE